MNGDEEEKIPHPQQIVDKYKPVILVPIENMDGSED